MHMSGHPLRMGLTIGITGSSGLIGSALATRLAASGHVVTRLRRQTGEGKATRWSAGGSADLAFDAIVHLAGEPIASGRWNAAQKARIRASRVEGTRSLCDMLAHLSRPPRTLLCASAVGFYGDRGDELLDEHSDPGSGFLSQVAQAWEASAEPAIRSGIRVVFLRFGMVLSSRGGALRQMLPLFRCGLGGRIGNGRQYWSWITLDDALGVVAHALADENLTGPVNVVAPHPVTNAEFTAALGSALGRPVVFNVPAWAARVLLGQMADAMLLASVRAVPRRLQESGYTFLEQDLPTALRHVLECPVA
jgi:uncharacterized protein